MHKIILFFASIIVIMLFLVGVAIAVVGVPIPKGFEYLEGTNNRGLVINDEEGT